MGCVYTGLDTRKSVNGSFKIGMTENKTPTSRLTANGLTLLYYVHIPNASKAELLLMESAMRVAVERMGKKLSGNDYFSYNARGNKWTPAIQMGKTARDAAIAVCEQLNLKYYKYKNPKIK